MTDPRRPFNTDELLDDPETIDCCDHCGEPAADCECGPDYGLGGEWEE